MSPKPNQPISDHDQAHVDLLKSVGLELDPVTMRPRVVDEKAFQGVTKPSDGIPEPVSGSQTVTVLPSAEPIEIEEEEIPAVPPVPIEPESTESLPPKKPEGEEKRLQDTREAQQKLSKLDKKIQDKEAALNKLSDDITRKQSALEDQINKLAALQATSGGIYPEHLDPADAETVANFRKEYPEAVSVMEAVVAPVYDALSKLSERVNGLLQQWGEQVSKQRETEILEGVYQKIPKERVDQIVKSDDFGEWLAGKPERKRLLYIDILNNTTKGGYTSADALDVFDEFSKDTGVKLITNGKAPRRETPPMDETPRLRTGSALPTAAPPAPARPNPSNELAPLSLQEAANFKYLLEEAPTLEARNILLQRLSLTQLSGDATKRPQSVMH
jgi:hypothetical protein